jgi:ABC-type sugar transport system substrate-binding protein
MDANLNKQASDIMGGITPETINRLMESLNHQQKVGQIGAGIAGIGDAIQSVGGIKGEHMQNAENMLDKLREADGIFCPNESSTQGMLNVLKANGLAGKKIFVGFDASPALVSAMKAGEINALVAQNPLQMGYDTVRVLALSLNGKEVPKSVDTGCALVTKENLDTPEVKKVLGT